jgi:hypothetical protein
MTSDSIPGGGSLVLVVNCFSNKIAGKVKNPSDIAF